MKSPITFIILSYHSDPKSLTTILSNIQGQQIIVVDNSEIESKKVRCILSEKLLKRITLLEQEKNLGYTGGMNVGMKHAFKQGAEWVVLFNDDITFTPKTIQALVGILNEHQPGVVGPFGGQLDKKRWTTILKPAQENQQIDYISGSCMAIHTNVMRVVQEFYPHFFMYYEDVDLCMQAKKAKFPVEQIRLPDIAHHEGTSIEKGSPLHEYYLARNHLLFVERQAPLPIKIHEILRLPKTIYEHKFFMNDAAFKGVIDFLITKYGKAPKSIQG